MQVSDLIFLLEKLDPEWEVFISKDAEGNGFSPLADEHTIGVYVPESTWAGEFYSDPGDDVDEETILHYAEWWKDARSVKGICLLPVN